MYEMTIPTIGQSVKQQYKDVIPKEGGHRGPLVLNGNMMEAHGLANISFAARHRTHYPADSHAMFRTLA